MSPLRLVGTLVHLILVANFHSILFEAFAFASPLNPELRNGEQNASWLPLNQRSTSHKLTSRPRGNAFDNVRLRPRDREIIKYGGSELQKVSSNRNRVARPHLAREKRHRAYQAFYPRGLEGLRTLLHTISSDRPMDRPLEIADEVYNFKLSIESKDLKDNPDLDKDMYHSWQIESKGISPWYEKEEKSVPYSGNLSVDGGVFTLDLAKAGHDLVPSERRASLSDMIIWGWVKGVEKALGEGTSSDEGGSQLEYDKATAIENLDWIVLKQVDDLMTKALVHLIFQMKGKPERRKNDKAPSFNLNLNLIDNRKKGLSSDIDFFFAVLGCNIIYPVIRMLVENPIRFQLRLITSIQLTWHLDEVKVGKGDAGKWAAADRLDITVGLNNDFRILDDNNVMEMVEARYSQLQDKMQSRRPSRRG